MADINWAIVEAAVARGIEHHAAAYAIPANQICGYDRDAQRKLAKSWGQVMAPFVTACIREDLRKAEQPTARTDDDLFTDLDAW